MSHFFHSFIFSLLLVFSLVTKAAPPVIWNGTDALFINSGNVLPSADNSSALGSTAKRWGFGYIQTLRDVSDTNSVVPASRELQDTSGNMVVKWSTANTLQFNNAGVLALKGASGAGSFKQKGHATQTDYTVVWPDVQGAANSFIQNDGSGNLSWATQGAMPFGSSTSLVTTTSATTTFVNALTTSITVTAVSAPIAAECVLDMTSATSASVATVRVTINAVSGGSVTESLTTATTQHLTVPNHNLSTALGPGTYTVNCDFNRASGTGTVTVGQGRLNAVALQGATASGGITQISGLGLNAGPGVGLQSLTGTLSLAGGGTNASITAANGGIVYSTASALAVSAAGSANQILQSAGAASPTWSTATYPATTTINQILYSSAGNAVTGLATVNTGALVTSSTGVPSLTSGSTANRLLRTNGTTVSFAQANLTSDVTGTLPVANGGTGLASAFASGRIMFSNGSTNAADANFTWDTTNIRLGIGGVASARVGAVVSSGSDIGIQSFCQGTNNCVQIRNQAAYSLAMLHANDANTTGVLVGAERSRGTQTSRTQALSGDIGLNLVGTCYTGSASSASTNANIQFVLSENCVAGATGGEIVMYTTANTTATSSERLRIKHSGEVTLVNTHLKSTQTTAPTAVAQGNAGTGATCTLANATDTAGEINVTTGTIGISTGSYCQITFNKTHGVAPICTLTPAGSALSTSVYVTKSTTTFDINFAIAGGISTSYLINYHCIETQ